MSRMNFEHAYSGQNTSGGVGPHMDLYYTSTMKEL